ncbi:MAG: hypothetical protein R6V50_07700, partial [Thermoplasmatota archaeon]
LALFVCMLLMGAFQVFVPDTISADSNDITWDGTVIFTATNGSSNAPLFDLAVYANEMPQYQNYDRPTPPAPPENLQVQHDGFEGEILEPGEIGNYPFDSWTGSFTGPYGDNTPLDIYYPTTLENVPYPGLVLGHGFTMSKSYFETWGQYYASWGYVIAVPSLQYAKLFSVNHEKCAYELLATLDLLKDKNNDSQHPIYGLVDVDNLGLTGFSLGAKACILAVQYEAIQGKNNVKAVAPMAIAIGNVPDPLPGLYLIDIPVQLQAGENDLIAPPEHNSLKIYNGLENSSSQYFLIHGANHNQYADMNPISGGWGDGQATISRAEQHRIARKYTTSFFNYYLKNQYQYGEYLYGSFADQDVTEGVLVFNQFKDVDYDSNFTGTENNLVTWNASPDDITGFVDSYTIYRSEYQLGPWDTGTSIATVTANSSASYSYIDIGKGTADEILWWYVVRAVGTNGIEEMNTNAVMEANNIPNKPERPSGETSGKTNTVYTYTTKTIDADEDQVFYLWDWGDGTFSDWLGPFDSGEVASAEHSWSEEGSYSIRVKARDVYNAESEWSDPLPVTMPSIHQSHILRFVRIFVQRFSHVFPILYYFLGI